MASAQFDMNEIEKRMKGAVSSLRQEFGGLRTGRASAALLDPITINAYGSRLPLSQAATVTVPEPRMIVVQVWDRSQVSAVEKAIRESDLGLSPVIEGQILRLRIPELNQERRQELVKVASKYMEHAKVSVRNVRRDGMDLLKKNEKDGEMSEDESRALSTKVQDVTDRTIKEIDLLFLTKEKEIMQV